MQVILIGFMGSGKTTIGQLLARTLATNHIDLDEFIMQKAQQSITEIFATKGETYFRQLEQLYLKQTLKLPGVLSTGGGTPIIAPNAALLARSKIPIVWLSTSIQTTFQRIQNDTSRPLVNDLDTTALIKLQKKRNPLYQALANIIIPTDELTPQQIVTRIQRQLKLA